MKHYFYNPGQMRMAILGAIILLLMVFNQGKAEAYNKIEEVNVNAERSNTISVQVRTDDGRPVKFELFNSSGMLVHAQSIFHSKVTEVKGIPAGVYKYRFTSSDHDVYNGKVSVK